MFAQVDVLNVPAYAEECFYWVVKAVEGRVWFFGAWDQYDSAMRVARDEGGFVVSNQKWV